MYSNTLKFAWVPVTKKPKVSACKCLSTVTGYYCEHIPYSCNDILSVNYCSLYYMLLHTFSYVVDVRMFAYKSLCKSIQMYVYMYEYALVYDVNILQFTTS